MELNFGILLGFTDALATGLRTTAKLTLICIALGCSLGFVIGLARSSGSVVARWVAGTYVEIFRGTPVLIQLFWVFFCLPLLTGVELSNMTSGVLTLTLYMGAITSETFRASLKNIGKEQLDACVALGLSRWTQVRNVILPQALLRAIPTLLSNCVSLFKESSLVSAVGIADLMYVGQNISNNTAHPVEVLTAVAVIYFVIAYPLTRAVSRVEKRVIAKLST